MTLLEFVRRQERGTILSETELVVRSESGLRMRRSALLEILHLVKEGHLEAVDIERFKVT